MATTSLAIGNEILSTTMYVLMKEWKDNLHESIAFLDAHERIHGAGQPQQAGGSRIIQALGFGEHSKPTRMRSGYERIDLSVSDVFVPAVYDWAHVKYPVAISGEEEAINQGESAIISILEGRTMSVAAAAKRDFVRQTVAGGVAGWEDWGTLNGLDFSGGFLEENAVGSQTNIVGGVSKATYSDVVGWQNQVFDGQNSFNSNGLAGLYALATAARLVSPDGDFDVWLFSEDAFNNLKRALQAQERYIKEVGDGGKLVQMWNGVQIDTEINMPNDANLGGGASGTTPVSAYGLSLKNLHHVWDPDGYFELGQFERISGEFDVRSAEISIRGQFCGKHLGSQGVAHSLNAF